MVDSRNFLQCLFSQYITLMMVGIIAFKFIARSTLVRFVRQIIVLLITDAV